MGIPSGFFPVLFTFQLLLFQISSISGTRKLTLRYQWFVINFDFEISTVDCLINVRFMHTVIEEASLSFSV